MKKRVIITSGDAEPIEWLSDGWNSIVERDKPEQKALMATVHECMRKGTDIADVKRRLEEAGFEVEFRPLTEIEKHVLETVSDDELKQSVEMFNRIFGIDN